MQPEEVAPVLAQNVICFVVICHGARGASSGFQQKFRMFRYFYAKYNEKSEFQPTIRIFRRNLFSLFV